MQNYKSKNGKIAEKIICLTFYKTNNAYIHKHHIDSINWFVCLVFLLWQFGSSVAFGYLLQ